MPELPEVEVTRRALEPHVAGQVIAGVVVRDHRLRWPVPHDLPLRLVGQRVEGLERRGKYLLWKFERGTLLSHLGMSGAWRIHPRPGPVARKHDHIDLEFDKVLVRLTDPRRFGALLWHDRTAGPIAAHPLLVALGMEPFDPRFEGTLLRERMHTRSAPIKQVLLAGDVVVGVGNIYASESLFRAGINPKGQARRLGVERCARLASAVREVLTEAIGVGGSTLRDFVSAAGDEGYFMRDADVYGRTGLPCRVCGTSIVRITQGQRAT
ncbi:MAG: bifunctional DNA-formamidopyrimidine glycosylase/DNA-(apurinic or apyrimidinic site) lyase, partial [Burkholderiaceae bacterium]